MYDMLSGWLTARKLACLIFMKDIGAFILKHGGKQSWFDYHKCFLEVNHVYKRSKNVFYRDRVERSPSLLG